jgi:hypothetical protein
MNPFERYAFPIIDNLSKPDQFLPPPNQEDRENGLHVWRLLEEIEGEIESISHGEVNSKSDIISEEIDGNTTSVKREDDFFSDRVIHRVADAILDDEEREILDRGIYAGGIDVLAFYKSPHRLKREPFHGRWGIFIFAQGAKSVAEEIDLYYPGKWGKTQCILKALKFIHRHERFHWYIDAWTIQHEAINNKPLYENYLNFYYAHLHPHGTVEEALANRHAYFSMRRDGITDFMYDFMLRQPGMYARQREDPVEKRAKLAAHIIDGAGGILIPHRRDDQEPWIGTARPWILADVYCPVYLITCSNLSKILAPHLCGPGFHEHEKFVINYLSGKPLSRTDHDYFKIDNGEKLKMPNKHGKVDRLKSWELDNTLFKAGMKYCDYREQRDKTRTWTMHVPRPVAIPPLGRR